MGPPVGIREGDAFGCPGGMVDPDRDVIGEATILREPDPVVFCPLKIA